MSTQIATVEVTFSVPIELNTPASVHVALPSKSTWLNDSRIAKVAEQRLRESPYCCLMSVKAEANDGILVLRGGVNSYYHKQLAQEMVRNIDKVRAVKNCVQVIDEATAC
jgi:osmotically-inducible protein OsmY